MAEDAWMRITDIRIEHLRVDLAPPFAAAWDPIPRRSFDATLVRVRTDEGLEGVGSGDTMLGLAGHEDRFVGRDPLDLADHVRTIESIHFHGGRCWPLEVALWDLVGQICAQPVAALLGNALREVPAYASCGELKPPGPRAESALALRDEGFRAMKIRVARDRLEEGIATVAAVREAVGTDLDIMVDLNQAWRMAGDVEPGAGALDGPADRRAAARSRRALGRGAASLRRHAGPARAARPDRCGHRGRARCSDAPTDVLGLLEADALDVYQPDVVLALGMSRARTVAELCRLRHRQFTPHTWTNGIGLLANLHVTAGVGGGPYLEVPHDPPGWTAERRDFMLAERLRINARGCVEVPRVPGIGARLDEEAVAAARIG